MTDVEYLSISGIAVCPAESGQSPPAATGRQREFPEVSESSPSHVGTRVSPWRPAAAAP